MRVIKPSPFYKHRSLEATSSNDISVIADSIKILENAPEEDRHNHTQKIAEATDMASGVKIACEGVKIDSDFFKGGFDMVSLFYSMHLKRIHGFETGENRPIEYFKLDCFKNPSEAKILDEKDLEIYDKINYETQNQHRSNILFDSFDVRTIKFPKEHTELNEMKFDGTTYQGHGSSASPSSPSSSEISSEKENEELKSIMESVF